jgi:hypothetical protein
MMVNVTVVRRDYGDDLIGWQMRERIETNRLHRQIKSNLL